MRILIRNLRPQYMSEPEVAGSDIYLQPAVTLEQGRRYLVCARSGHGKSSLLNFIYGGSRRYDGKIEMEGMEDVSQERMRREVLSYMFQDLRLFAQLTAAENVLLKNRLTDYKSGGEIERMLDALLPSEKKRQPVGTLSLGQQQRVAAVRALCQPFAFLLLDEPFSHLDNESAAMVSQLMVEEAEKQHAGIILTSLGMNDNIRFDRIFKL